MTHPEVSAKFMTLTKKSCRKTKAMQIARIWGGREQSKKYWIPNSFWDAKELQSYFKGNYQICIKEYDAVRSPLNLKTGYQLKFLF